MSKPRERVRVSDQANDAIEIDLGELFAFFRSQLLLLIIAVLAGALLAGMVTHFMITPKYTATSKVYMVSASSDTVLNLSDFDIGTSLSEDYIELIKIRPVLEEVIDDLDLPYDDDTLLGMISIATVGDTRLLAISAESESATEAADIANALAKKSVTYIPELMEVPEPHIAEEAEVPEYPSSPNLVKNTIMGAFGFFAIMIVILTVLYLLDDTMKTAEDVEKAFGVMPLTVVPEGEIAEISDQREEELLKKKNRHRHRKHSKKADKGERA